MRLAQTVRRPLLSSSLLLITALVTACATSPLGRNQLVLFPESEMTQMGLSAYQEMKQQTPASTSAVTNRYVQGQSVAVAPVEDIFNEFSYGVRDAAAIAIEEVADPRSMKPVVERMGVEEAGHLQPPVQPRGVGTKLMIMGMSLTTITAMNSPGAQR